MTLVYVKNKKNQTTYVYESTAYWDKEKQQSRNTRVCIGKLVDNVFVPNKQYKMRQELEQLRQEIPSKHEAVRTSRKFYGATYLLDQIGERYGISHDLQACFPDSFQQILSLAYFLVLEENNTISRFPTWAATHALPYEKAISAQQCVDLFRSVTPAIQSKFFQLQVHRREEQEYLSFDISSASSYVETYQQIKYRGNKDHGTLAQINLTLISGEKSKIPVCYKRLPSTISDVSTLKKMLREFSTLIKGKTKFILDRDFFSEENVDALYSNHYKFLMGTRVSLPYIQRHLDPVRETIKKRANYHSSHQLGSFSGMSVWPHKRVKKRSQEVVKSDKRIYVHLYYSEQLALDERSAFTKRLDRLEEELYANTKVPSHEDSYNKYFHIRHNAANKRVLTLQQENIVAKQKDFGYFALISNDFKDPIEALEVYQGRSMIENTFSNLKERLNMRGTPLSYEQNLEGKLFAQFIAQMFVSVIDTTMKEKNLYSDYSMTSLLDSLDLIERHQRPGHPTHIGELTEDQIKIYADFGFDPPSPSER